MTQSVSPSVGSNAASAGRSMPGMVRSASLAMAIIAPVLPADKAASAMPSFTALIAMPIEVVRARRIAWLGFSSAVMNSAVWTIVTPDFRLAWRFSSARISFSSPKTRNSSEELRRRARAAPASIAAGPLSPPMASIAMRGPAFIASCPSPAFALRPRSRRSRGRYNGRRRRRDCAAASARRSSGIPGSSPASAHDGCGACCASRAMFFSLGQPLRHLFQNQ